mgnify:CR=1 FL=1
MSAYFSLKYGRIDSDDVLYHPNKWVDDGDITFVSTYCFRGMGHYFVTKDNNTVYIPVNLHSKAVPLGSWGGSKVSIPWLRTVKAFVVYLRKIFPTLDIKAGKTVWSLDEITLTGKSAYYVRVRTRDKKEPADQFFVALNLVRFLATEFTYRSYHDLYADQKSPREFLKTIFEKGGIHAPGHFPAYRIYDLITVLNRYKPVLERYGVEDNRSMFCYPFGEAIHDFLLEYLPNHMWSYSPLTNGTCTTSGLDAALTRYMTSWYDRWAELAPEGPVNNDNVDFEDIDEEYEW